MDSYSSHPQLITNFLLTEREGRTGDYWPEVVAVRTERSEVRTKTIYLDIYLSSG